MRSRIEVQNGNDDLCFESGLVSIGGRTGVDVLLRDVMVADRHCIITFEDGFVIRDTGSVTGTWVDGKQAKPSAALTDGSSIIIGTTKIQVSIDEDDGVQLLKLTTALQSFWWKKSGKGVFDNDPDQLVYSETKFGRFPSLKLSNRIAIIAGAVTLLGATFFSAIMEPLADAGPLQPTHAATFGLGASAHKGFLATCANLSGQQGCNVCHTTGQGTPESKCRQCHSEDHQIAAPGSWRHPYLLDGVVGNKGIKPEMQKGEQICVACHTDHRGATTFKPASDALKGDCSACHLADQKTLLNQLPELELGTIERPFATFSFPHDKHLAQKISCETCHVPDPKVIADRLAGMPDEPSSSDYGIVSYETCASCHVQDASAVNMSAKEQLDWRKKTKQKDQQWQVDWHGTDEDGKHCLQCHTESQAGDTRVIGPDMRKVERTVFTAQQYLEQRAFYKAAPKSHDEQFLAHQNGKNCTECHLEGKLQLEAPQDQLARPFYHGLHMAQGALSPIKPEDQASISQNTSTGCVSCHNDLASDLAAGLTPISEGAYHWPNDESSQAACKECHVEGNQQLMLRHVPRKITAKKQPVVDFPHNVHVGSAAFGKSGSLAGGCFACHLFSEPSTDDPFAHVPRILTTAANCTQCHDGHNDIAGGDCQQCHPSVAGKSNSFLVQAKRAEPPLPTREWPAINLFSHLSPGHDLSLNKDMTCATCHTGRAFGLTDADTLQKVRVPDETAAVCRDCHLKKQFHWR